MATDTYNGLDPHQRAFIKLVKETAHSHRCYEVFRDFCELAALSFSNAVDRQQFEAREARLEFTLHGLELLLVAAEIAHDGFRG